MKNQKRITFFCSVAFVMGICILGTTLFPAHAADDSTKTYTEAEAKRTLTEWVSTRTLSEWTSPISRIGFAQLQALAKEKKVKSMTTVKLPSDPQSVEPYTLLEVSVVLDQGCILTTLRAQIYFPQNRWITLSLFQEVGQQVICDNSGRMGVGN